jgi:hypothetical protein
VVILGLGLGGTGAGLFLSQGRAVEEQQATPESRQAKPTKDKDTGKGKGEAEAIRQGKNNLKQLGIAMHNYESTHGQLPPSAIVSKDGKRLLSWRVLLLPYLEEDKLFKQFKLDEPWDSDHNKKLLARMPRVYAPTLAKKVQPGATPFQVFTGPGTIFPGNRGSQITDITDGTSNTILIVEAASAVPWTKPEDLPFDPKKPLPRLGGRFEAGFLLALADGSVFLGKKDFDQDILRSCITASGGEVVDLGKILAKDD